MQTVELGLPRTASLAPQAVSESPLPPREAPRRRLAIAVGMGWGVRNYLLSDALAVLQERFELVIVSEYSRVASFRKHFKRQKARVVSWSLAREPGWARELSQLAATAFYHRTPSASHRRKLRDIIARGQAGAIEGRIGRCAAPVLYPLLAAAYRRALERDWKAVSKMVSLFQREQVDAVFSTNLMNLTEWAAVLAGRLLGLPVVGAITSWDNPSTKRFPLCTYDGLLAWSLRMKQHTRKYLRVRPSRIHVVGAPQFDYYRNPDYWQSRSQFCRQHGLDPGRKIIVYSTVTPGIMPDDPHMVAHVHDLIVAGKLPGRPQLLVRLHPKDRIERYDAVRRDPQRREIAWTLAGEPRLQKRDQWCPDRDDLVRAVNTVRHGDVNVHCRYSTMMLDFASQDKPVVVIAYDARGDTAGARAYEEYEHLKPVLSSGGVRIAYRADEAEAYLRRALEHPEADADARRRMVRSELGQLDGLAGRRAGEAVANIVERALQRRRPRLRRLRLRLESCLADGVIWAWNRLLRRPRATRLPLEGDSRARRHR